VPLGERAFSGLAVAEFPPPRLPANHPGKRAPGGGALLQETSRGKAAPDLSWFSVVERVRATL